MGIIFTMDSDFLDDLRAAMWLTHTPPTEEEYANRIGLEHSKTVLVKVHSPELCEGRPCPLHNRTDHRLRSWKQHWRDDRGIVERICPDHGIGHPDPDHLDYWREQGREYEAVHGCCGCCALPDSFFAAMLAADHSEEAAISLPYSSDHSSSPSPSDPLPPSWD